MKKHIFWGLILILLGSFIFAQSPSLFVTETEHYRIYSEVDAETTEYVGKGLEAFFELYNNYLRFDISILNTKLNVRIFADKGRFDEYLTSVVGETRNNYVYLQYSTLKKSELLCYPLDDIESIKAALIRHSFIQFIKSFVKNPPLWLQQGFAVFFERSIYDEEHDLAVYKENLGWLATLQSMIGETSTYTSSSDSDLLTLSQLLQPDASILQEKNEIFHAQSWGFIMFLLNSDNKNYNRLLWDSLSVLKNDGTLKENEMKVQSKAFDWVNEYLLYTDFTNYIASIKTFPDIVREGVDLYTLGNYEDAEKAFIRAISLDGSHYIPYYYLGLIHYAQEDYSLVEYYYQSSLMLGADSALVYYALGVNAFADDRFEDSKSYLREASRLKPTAYSKKTDRILQRIEAAEMTPVDYSEEGEPEVVE
jgi:tetratricopeptide (TPR) repeat protein